MKLNKDIELVEEDLSKFIFDLIAVAKNQNIDSASYLFSSDIKTCIENYALRNNLSEKQMLDLSLQIAQRSR
jgi:hypothetical protein